MVTLVLFAWAAPRIHIIWAASVLSLSLHDSWALTHDKSIRQKIKAKYSLTAWHRQRMLN